MATSETHSEPIRIKDADHQVVLQPANNDLFVRTGKQVIEACRLGISIELWLNEFGGMLDEVRRWAEQRGGRIRACFCGARGARVVLFLVPSAGSFDFDLADELAELNSRVVQGFNIGMVEIHQIPWGELERFLDLESARVVYGERPEPHPAVEAQP